MKDCFRFNRIVFRGFSGLFANVNRDGRVFGKLCSLQDSLVYFASRILHFKSVQKKGLSLINGKRLSVFQDLSFVFEVFSHSVPFEG